MDIIKRVDLTNTNYGSIKDIEYKLAILPWGAIEAHNYHLPYLTDSILSHAIAVDAAVKVYADSGVNVMVLPSVDGGSQNPGQHKLPFCIHYRYETQKAILNDTIDALERQGINRLLIINGHGGNSFKNMIRDLYIDHPNFIIATTEWYRVENSKNYFEATIDDHAAETESSVMLYYYPDKINLSEAGDGNSVANFAIDGLNDGIAWVPRHWDKLSVDSGVGSPHLATRQKGEIFAKEIVEKLSKFITDFATKNLY